MTERPTPLYLHILVTAMFVLPCIAVSQFTSHLEETVIDDHLFGYFGWRIWNGAVMYVDVWDNKPPGIFWLNALACAVSSGSYLGIVAFCVLALLVTHILFFLVAARLYSRGTAALMTILAAFYLTHGQFYGGSNRSETFLIPCELAAIGLYLLGYSQQDRKWSWFLCGMPAGAAFLFKQTGLAAMLAIGLHLAWLTMVSEIRWSDAWRRAGLVLGGWATVVGTAVGALAAQGAIGEVWFAVVGFNRLKVAHGAAGWTHPTWWSRWCDRYVLSILRLPLLMALAAGLHSLAWRLRPRSRDPEIHARMYPAGPCCPRPMTLLVLWYFAALAGAIASPGSEGHHFLSTMPPLLLLAGQLVHALKAELSLLDRLAQRAWVTLAFVLLGYFAWDAIYLQFQKTCTVAWDRGLRREDGHWIYDDSIWEDLGNQLARVTQPDETVQCWENRPAVYLRAKRNCASRYAANSYEAMVDSGAVQLGREFVADLHKHPPKVLVITKDRYVDMSGTDAAHPHLPTPEGEWIDEHYRRRPDLTRADLYVFLRRDE